MTDTVIDREMMANLLDVMDGDADLVIEVIDLFLDDTPRRIDAMIAAVESRDPVALMQAAHSLKGSSANVGARGLWGICANLEQRGRNGSMAGAEALCGSIRREFDAVRSALEAERRRIGRPEGAETRLAV